MSKILKIIGILSAISWFLLGAAVLVSDWYPHEFTIFVAFICAGILSYQINNTHL